MISSSEVKSGMVIRISGELYIVITSEMHSGGGQAGSAIHLKYRNLRTGNIKETRFHPTEKIEDVAVEHRVMEFLYRDGPEFFFMDPESFEQISLPGEVIGHREVFLQPNMRIPVDLYDGIPVNVRFPDVVELKVTSAPAARREHDSSVLKTVTLENGLEVLAPQFIKEGEVIRIELETGKYLERARREGRRAT